MNTQEEQWLTGFVEGDGGIYLTHSRRYLRVFFGQKEREPLDYVCSLLGGGNVHHSGKVFRLEYNNRSYAYLFEVFARHVAGISFCERLNVILEFLKLPPITIHTPTIDWLVGFWDAEGSSSNQVSIDLTQKERDILDTIATIFGGSVSQNPSSVHQWRLCGHEVRELAPEIERRSHNPQKIKLLLNNLSGPTYYELHREERKAQSKSYYNSHRAGRKEHYEAHKSERLLERRQTRAYIKAHPEVEERLASRP